MRSVSAAKQTAPYVKDAFHEYVVHGKKEAVNPATPARSPRRITCSKSQRASRRHVRLRLSAEDEAPAEAFAEFDKIFAQRRREADAFYDAVAPAGMSRRGAQRRPPGLRGAALDQTVLPLRHRATGSTAIRAAAPPPERHNGRNRDWAHLFNRDIISMPDKWEYPWYAAWDLAFHMIPFSRIDPRLCEGAAHALSARMVHAPERADSRVRVCFRRRESAGACVGRWRIYKITGAARRARRAFLESVFQKLLLNFTWWVNRKDVEGKNLFAGGFLGLDNIGVFDRSKPLPTGGMLAAGRRHRVDGVLLR